MAFNFPLRWVFVPLSIFVALFIFAPSGSAQEGIIPKGTRAATEADLEWMRAAGIETAAVGMSINPSDPRSGQAVGEAKLWLAKNSKLNKTRIYCLNPQFALNLKSLMEGAPGGPPEITDAYRTEAEQNALPSGSTQVSGCGSYHNYGLAVDFNSKNTSEAVKRWLRVNAASKGLSPVTNANPVTGCTPRGFCDSGHIQMAGALPSRNQCDMCTPEGARSAGSGAAVQTSPTSGLANSIRSALGVQPQQPPQQPIASQPLQTGQTTLNAFNGNAALPIPVVSNSIGTSVVASSSIADRLEELAFGQNPTSTTQGATSVPLVISGSSIGGIVSSNNQNTVTTNPTYNGTPIQQTFTSSDLSWQAKPTVPQSTFQQTLSILQNALVQLLAYLKPFGGKTYAVQGME